MTWDSPDHRPTEKPLTLWDPRDDEVATTWSVSELGEALTAAVRKAFPHEVWVRGEIRNLNRSTTDRGTSVYIDLVEPAPGPDLSRPAIATLPVVLFDKARRRVNTQLREAGGAVRMENGTEVRIGGRIDFWAPRGRLQLLMSEIDPAFTLGRLAADRERLLRQLDAEGLLHRQKRLPLPVVPLRIGLVTSVGSAAEHDVIDELRRSAIGFRVQRVDARVQGREAPRSVAAALRLLAGREVDLILLVRGGGSATDLAAFDSELIARTIAQLPVPVVTGIGHDVDHSVADEVAHTSYKTPTATAQGLVGIVREYEARLLATWAAIVVTAQRSVQTQAERLHTCARHVAVATRQGLWAADGVLTTNAGRLRRSTDLALDRAARHLARSSAQVEAGARIHLRGHEAELAAAAARVRKRAPQVIDAEQRHLDGLDVQVRAFDPERTLARGWSITRTAAGRLVRSPSDARVGDMLLTTVAGGRVTSVVQQQPEEQGPPP